MRSGRGIPVPRGGVRGDGPVRLGERPEVWTRIVDPPEEGYGRWARGGGPGPLGRGVHRADAGDARPGGPDGDPARVVLGSARRRRGRPGAPLIVLYVVDTLRADHTGPYGHSRDTTPALDELAREAVVFEQAVAQSSWTKPSMASMMTSLLPGQHGAFRRLDRLSPDHETLAEILQEKGLGHRGGGGQRAPVRAPCGVRPGLRLLRRPSRAQEAAGPAGPGGVAVDKALGVARHPPGAATFLWIHTMDPHAPYKPPAPFDRMFSPDEVPDLPDQGDGAEASTTSREGERRDEISQYDGEIAFGDRELGRFLRELEARGLYDRALIVFVSDHGDEFLDHGGRGHGLTLFDELVRVPLLVKFPGGRHGGQRVSRQVLGLDVMPTILHAAGDDVPAGAWPAGLFRTWWLATSPRFPPSSRPTTGTPRR